MASIERRADHASAFRFGSLLSVFAARRQPIGAAAANADLITARSLASVGLIGLAGLPMLMLASVLLQAPLAAPAMISLGYLGAAHALTTGHKRSAVAWTLAVCGGFVIWTLLVVLVCDEGVSPASFAALLLGPVFAAAPALTRRLVAGAPAASAPASACPQCAAKPGSASLETGQEAAGRAPARVASDDLGLSVVPARERPAAPVPARPVEPARLHPGARADVQDAVAFALRHVGPKARSKGISFVCSGDSTVAAAIDRQVCRRLLNALLGEMVHASPLGSTVHILARAVKGAVLLRVTCSSPAVASMAVETLSEPLGLETVRQMVDAIGGTLMTTRSGDAVCASLRLARAQPLVRQGPQGHSSGAA